MHLSGDLSFQTTKRPQTAGFNFKNSIIALVERLATKVRSLFINSYTPFEEEGVYRSHCVGLSVGRPEAIFCPAYFLQTTRWNSIKFYMKLPYQEEMCIS